MLFLKIQKYVKFIKKFILLTSALLKKVSDECDVNRLKLLSSVFTQEQQILKQTEDKQMNENKDAIGYLNENVKCVVNEKLM